MSSIASPYGDVRHRVQPGDAVGPRVVRCSDLSSAGLLAAAEPKQKAGNVIATDLSLSDPHAPGHRHRTDTRTTPSSPSSFPG